MKENKMVAAICAAPTILGHLGYLKGKNYTCFTSMDEDFGGTYKDAYAVVDGNIITSRGMGTAIDFALEIVRYFMDDDTVEKIKKALVY